MSLYFVIIFISISICGLVYVSYKSKKEYDQLERGDYIQVYDSTDGTWYSSVVIISEDKKCYMDRNTGIITPFSADDIFRGNISIH